MLFHRFCFRNAFFMLPQRCIFHWFYLGVHFYWFRLRDYISHWFCLDSLKSGSLFFSDMETLSEHTWKTLPRVTCVQEFHESMTRTNVRRICNDKCPTVADFRMRISPPEIYQRKFAPPKCGVPGGRIVVRPLIGRLLSGRLCAF